MANTEAEQASETAPLLPMEASLVDALPEESGWQFEPKWDGFRCIAIKSEGGAKLFAKSGKVLHRYFPEVVAMVEALPGKDFVLDGELAIPLDATLSFNALQQRLHPAESRIKKLAAETPAILIVFDLPTAPGGADLTALPLRERRAKLESMLADRPVAGIKLSPFTLDRAEAQKWLDHSSGALDGVVAKRLDGPYLPEERAMLKVKRIRSADCVVGGFRYGEGKPTVGSLLLGLYDDEGRLNHVGYTSMISNAERAELTTKLEALAGGPGFTGKAPGGPSRWSTERTSTYEPLKHELVVEVLYDQVTDHRFRHGTRLHRWRPDKTPKQCTMAQLEPPSRPDEIIAKVIGE